MDKRRRHRELLKAVAEGTATFVFYSRKLREDEPRNCQFCGEIFLPGHQPGLETPTGPAHPIGDERFAATSARQSDPSCAVASNGLAPSRGEAFPVSKVDRSAILKRDNYVFAMARPSWGIGARTGNCGPKWIM